MAVAASAQLDRNERWPLRGVLPVLCTPFDAGGAVDPASLGRHARDLVDAGVDGMVAFGLASEVYKLSDDERGRVLETVVAAVDGAVPVIVGCEHDSLEAARDRAETAAAAGAAGVMAFPPSFIPPDPVEVVEYYRQLSTASGLPVIVQDAPAWTGVPLDVPRLSEIAGACPTPVAVKVEAPPTAPKIARLTGEGVPTIGGYGILHLAEELAAGIVATMPGSALPRAVVELWRVHAAGDEEEARARYERLLPLLVFQMGSLDLFVAVQKTLLARAGVLASPSTRRPGGALDARQRTWLEGLVERLPDVRTEVTRGS